MTRMPHVLRAVATAAVLALGACSTVSNGSQNAFNPMARYPITVEPRMMTLRLPYSGGAGLDDNMREQLSRFAQDFLEHGSGALAISGAPGNPDAPGYFATQLADLGVPRGRILIGNDETETGEEVKITFIRYVADAPACGDWSTNLAFTAANLPDPNLGCATQHNIAVMVADPRDLVTPQPLGPGDAEHNLAVLQKYRQGQTTVAAKTTEQSGAVSDVGQNQ
jgi:pilus assembly protein CpaD